MSVSPNINDREWSKFDASGQVKISLHRAADGAEIFTQQVTQAGADTDGVNQSALRIAVVADQRGYNGASWDRLRVPTVFKSVNLVVTAGTPLAAWTPAGGKKFRLMGYDLGLSVAGVIILKDATTEVGRAARAAGAGAPSPPLGNGIFSATANNVLNIDVSTSGTVSGIVFGTEE